MNAATIIDIVTRHKNVPKEQIFSKTRKQDVVYARQLIIYFIRINTLLTMEIIAETIGKEKKDHSLMSRSCKRVMGYLKVEESVKEDVRIINSQLSLLNQQVTH